MATTMLEQECALGPQPLTSLEHVGPLFNVTHTSPLCVSAIPLTSVGRGRTDNKVAIAAPVRAPDQATRTWPSGAMRVEANIVSGAVEVPVARTVGAVVPRSERVARCDVLLHAPIRRHTHSNKIFFTSNPTLRPVLICPLTLDRAGGFHSGMRASYRPEETTSVIVEPPNTVEPGPGSSPTT